jgi:hypothetical protein
MEKRSQSSVIQLWWFRERAPNHSMPGWSPALFQRNMLRRFLTPVSLFLFVSSPDSFGVQTPLRDHRLNRKKPGVYIELVKIGKAESLNGLDKIQEYVWLKLHNNTKWKVNVQMNGVPAEYGDAWLCYGVETLPEPERVVGFGQPAEPVPVPIPLSLDGTTPPIHKNNSKTESDSSPTPQVADEECKLDIPAGCHVSSINPISPKDSVTFVVQREHLCKNTRIYVLFEYDWEEAGMDEPEHRVYFGGRKLESEKRK